jgi:hypothetical protein
MFEVPAAIPLTIPEADPIEAMPGNALVQTPPVDASDNADVSPMHTVPDPVIAAGRGCTVSVAVARQPVGNVYDITVVPKAEPVTVPVTGPTEAVNGSELLQIPPVVRSV